MSSPRFGRKANIEIALKLVYPILQIQMHEWFALRMSRMLISTRFEYKGNEMKFQNDKNIYLRQIE